MQKLWFYRTTNQQGLECIFFTDNTSISNQTWPGEEGETEYSPPSRTQPFVLPVTLWVCVTPWPWGLYINCHTASHAAPLDSLRAYRWSSSIPRRQKPLSCRLAFSLGRKPCSHATQQPECLCLLTLLPSLPGSPGWPGTPANPCSNDMRHIEWGCYIRVYLATAAGRLWPASGWKKKKRSWGQMFVPHVLGRFAVKGDTVLAGFQKKKKKKEGMNRKEWRCPAAVVNCVALLRLWSHFTAYKAICSLL